MVWRIADFRLRQLEGTDEKKAALREARHIG
jgi:hypothetical protein